MLDTIRDFFAESEVRPNKFTRFIGTQIKVAREEVGISQEELARKCYLRRATLSDIENGKTEPDTSAFTLLAYYLNKPLAYFLPEFMYNEMKKEELRPLEQELLFHFQAIHGDELQKLLISLVKVFSKFDPKDLVVELAPYVKERLDREEELRKLHEKGKKGK